jgi:hypothetical protein
MVRRVAFLHPQQQLRVLTAGQLTDNREPILAGEGGIRTLDSLYGSVCYRFYVAKDAKFAMHALAHCPVLPGGQRRFMDRS